MRRAATNRGKHGEPTSKREKSGTKTSTPNVARKRMRGSTRVSYSSTDSDSDTSSYTSASTTSSSSSSSSSTESDSESERKRRRHRRSHKAKSKKKTKYKSKRSHSHRKPYTSSAPATVQAMFAMSAVVPNSVSGAVSTQLPVPVSDTPKQDLQSMEAWSPASGTKQHRSRSGRHAHSTLPGIETKSQSKRSSKSSHASKSKKSKSSSKESHAKSKGKDRSSAEITSKSKKGLQKINKEFESRDKGQRRTPSRHGKEKHSSSTHRSSHTRPVQMVVKTESRDKLKVEKPEPESKPAEHKEEPHSCRRDSKSREHRSPQRRSASRERQHQRDMPTEAPVSLERSNAAVDGDAMKNRRESSPQSKNWRSMSRAPQRSRERRSPSDHSVRHRTHRRTRSPSISFRRRSLKRTPSPLRQPDRDLKAVRLHIRGLTRQVTKRHIIEIFSSFGPLTNVDFPIDHYYRGSFSGTGRGYAFVEFANPADCESALRSMDGGRIDGQRVIVSPFEKNMLRYPLRRLYSSPMNKRDRY